MVDTSGRITLNATAGAAIELGSLVPKVPIWAWVALGIGAGVFALHPAFTEKRRTVIDGLKTLCRKIPEVASDVFATYQATAATAAAVRAQAEEVMPATREPRRLSDIAFRVLLAAGRGMETRDIAKAVRCAGWDGSPRTLPANLGRLLRRDDRVMRSADGTWKVPCWEAPKSRPCAEPAPT
jgi:hypothetical protein